MPKAHIAPQGASLLPAGKNIVSSLLHGVPSGRFSRRFAPQNDRRGFVCRVIPKKTLLLRLKPSRGSFYRLRFRALFRQPPCVVARPNFSAVHFDYFLRESKPYAGISLFARVKPFKNVRKIILVNAVAVVVNRALVPLLKQFDNFLVVHFASPSTSKNRLRFVDDQTLRLTIKTTKNPRRCVKVKKSQKLFTRRGL